MATVRRNPDITNLVHDNMVYGLTKGQASPTSRRGFVTPVQVTGVHLEPFNPAAVAIALNASFVARGFSGDIDKTAELIRKAVAHRGYALVSSGKVSEANDISVQINLLSLNASIVDLNEELNDTLSSGT